MKNEKKSKDQFIKKLLQRIAELKKLEMERKKSEEDLRFSEAKFRGLFENVFDGIYQTTPDGKIISANPALVQMLGYNSEAELLAIDIAHDLYVTPEDRDLLAQRLEKKGELRNIELVLKRKDGHHVIVLENARAVRNEQNKVLYYEGTLIDITKRKKAEEALEKRIKELNCVYNISYLIEKPDISLEEILQGIVNIIPSAWQYPETTCARIIVKGQGFRTKNFRETMWKQVSDIVVHGKQIGTLEICYLEEKPESDEGPFLKEERSLLNAIANRLGRIVERKDAEEALRKREEKFNRLFNSNPEALIYFDKDFNIIDINLKFEKLFGYSIEEMRGKKIDEFIIPEDKMDESKKLKEISKKGYIFHETVRKRKDGTLIPVAISASPVISEGSMIGINVTYKDITERKKAEESLQKEKEYYRSFVEPLSDWAWEMDVNGVHTYSNSAVKDILGYKVEEVVGHHVTELWFDEAKTPETLNWLQKTLTRGKGWKDFYGRFKHKNGSTVTTESTAIPLFDSENKLIGYRGIDRDITERKKMEEMLRETRNYLEKLLNYANAPIIVWNPKFKITQFNHAFEHLTGYTADEIVGQELPVLFPKVSRKESLTKIEETLSGEYWKSVEIPILRKDGDIRVALWNSANIYAEDGKTLLATIAQGIDITERKKSEELLKKQREELSAFAHTVSHDLKNYIGFIRNSAQFSLLKKEYAEKNTERIIDMTKKMENFVNRQLQLADAGKAIGKPEEIDLNKLIDEVEKMYSTEIQMKGLPTIKGDPQRLKEAFHNLIDNAVKHGEADRIEISSEKKENIYVIHVKDNGKGIPKEDMDKIFDMGYSRTGTGIGLTIVKKIVEAHDGNISVRSKEGKGTTFEIIFPIKA